MVFFGFRVGRGEREIKRSAHLRAHVFNREKRGSRKAKGEGKRGAHGTEL